jgi:hypothetical protein
MISPNMTAWRYYRNIRFVISYRTILIDVILYCLGDIFPIQLYCLQNYNSKMPCDSSSLSLLSSPFFSLSYISFSRPSNSSYYLCKGELLLRHFDSILV